MDSPRIGISRFDGFGKTEDGGGMEMLLDPYRLDETTGILVPPTRVCHREQDYDSRGHDRLAAMQRDHFWYQGRHRFLLHAVRKWALPHFPPDSSPRVIDLGGGCGGWVRYLAAASPWLAAELALGDSSAHALGLAAGFLPTSTLRFQTDILDLQWTDRWDCAFLLDVLEHISDHEGALHGIRQAVAPGGLLFVTVPALKTFWSYVDEVGHHQRRYQVGDFAPLAHATGWELLDCRYFMFFLSPLLWLQRSSQARAVGQLTSDQRLELAQKGDEVPPWLINQGLGVIFASETPIGHLFRFPWGTSILAVMRKTRE
ncbi:MAG: class I SAM-dependent methyltransferase [Planctomycetota bacterium]